MECSHTKPLLYGARGTTLLSYEGHCNLAGRRWSRRCTAWRDRQNCAGCRSLARVKTDNLQLHRLVQAILRSRSVGDAGSDMPLATVRLLRTAFPSEPWANRATWPEWRRLLPHVLAATDRAVIFGCDGELAWLLDQAAAYLTTGPRRTSDGSTDRPACTRTQAWDAGQ
jgi:hypothetical protein